MLGLILVGGSLTLSGRGEEPADVFRFGTAQIGDRLTHPFALVNPDPQSLGIRSATPSCECVTVVQWPTTIAAGATGIVEVVFAPNKAGEVDYRVFLQTTRPDQPEIELAIQGMVTEVARGRTDRDWTLYLTMPEAEEVVQNLASRIWVDVRSAAAGARVRIPGALQIPLFAVKTKGFLRDRPLVLVDEGWGAAATEAECRKLRELGFKDVRIWYGGMNTWRQAGGVLEGEDSSRFDPVPPIALVEIAQKTDWLMVGVDSAPSNAPDGTVVVACGPDASQFAPLVNAKLQERPEVVSVLLATPTGADYDRILPALGQIDAYVHVLEGGWAAWESFQEMTAAAQHSRTIVSETTRSTDGRAIQRAGGCGGCPK